jgi:peptidoglycan/LPS O-acetylase OafA/YrhL
MRESGVSNGAMTHLPELDGIRGLAILCVLLSHGTGLTGLFRTVSHSSLEDFFAYFLVPLWGGVDLFFVLSGFLITSILLRTKRNANYFQSFYARRALRILPIYYLSLSSCLLFGHFSTTIGNLLPQWNSWIAAYFFYIPNWPYFWHGQRLMGGLWGAYWSLAVEEQFYIVWPFLVLLFSEKALFRLCLAGCIVALPLRLILSSLYFGGSFGLAQITTSRVDGLFLGGLISIYMSQNRRPLSMKWILAFGCAGASILAYIGIAHASEFVSAGKWITTVGITGYALASACLVALSQHHPPRLQAILTSGALRSLGKYSYGIYVYHLLLFLPVAGYIRNHAIRFAHMAFATKVLIMLVEIAVIYCLAKLSYDHFEICFLRLKRLFCPVRGVAAT